MAFSGKSENFPASSTKFVALMLTKGLFRTVLGNDDLPEAELTLPESPNSDQQAVYDTKMQERAVLIQQRKNNRNTASEQMAMAMGRRFGSCFKKSFAVQRGRRWSV